MKSLAIIPARGGSKRLPRKNIADFMGKPMLLWTCEAARETGLFDSIIVSTEDEDIAGIVVQAGFTVDMRPPELATDAATCAQVCLELLDKLAQGGQAFSSLCCLYATAPLRRACDITGTMALLDNPEVDFAHAVSAYDFSPYQMFYENPSGYLAYAWPLLASKKSQELPVPVGGNGSTYAARVSMFRKYRDFYGPRLKGYLMPRVRSVDIDTRDDLDLARFLGRYLQGEGA